MSKDGESSYSEILKSRGFTAMPPMLIDGEAKTHTTGSPRFCMMSQINMTHAVDELGHVWMKEGLTSLTDCGFADISHVAQVVMRLFTAVEIDGERFDIPKLQ